MNQVHKIAEALCNTKLLSKLSEGDMIATEAKYHLKCLTNLYNTYRNHVSSKPPHCSDKERYKGIAFSEVINFVEDSLDHIEGGVPVFKLCELVNMYRKELERYNVSENIHVSRFKQRILDNVPCLSQSKVGRIVVLTVTDEVGHALIKTCSDEDDGIILSKAARIIRRSLLSTDEVFNGDVSRERHTASVPSSLVQLIELILEGKYVLTKNPNLRRISENIAQLIRFNSVKQKRRGNVSSGI